MNRAKRWADGDRKEISLFPYAEFFVCTVACLLVVFNANRKKLKNNSPPCLCVKLYAPVINQPLPFFWAAPTVLVHDFLFSTQVFYLYFLNIEQLNSTWYCNNIRNPACYKLSTLYHKAGLNWSQG